MTALTTKTPPKASSEGAVPVAPVVGSVKLRRRPVYIIASVAALLLGALAGVWLWTSATSTVEVVVARTTVHRGSVITAADIAVVRVNVDPTVVTVPASQASSLVGKRAALDIATGGLLTPADVATTLVPGKGMTVVGLALGKGMLPAIPMQAGDLVRVVQTPGSQGQVSDGVPVTIPATVVGVSQSADGQAMLVDLLVSSDQAPDLASRAATGKVAVVLDSRER